MNSKSLSIIIPVGKNDVHLDHCLSSISRSTISPTEVIIVFDGWVKEFSQALHSEMNLRLFYEEKCGPAACRNIGASHAIGDLICFCDSDIELHINTLERAVDFVRKEGIDGVIGSYDDEPFHSSIISQFRNRLHRFHHQKNHLIDGVFWGAFGMIKKEVFLETGMFNTVYERPSIEDIEFGYRLKERGYRVLLNANLLIKHRKAWTLKNVIHTDIFLRAKPWTLLLDKYPQNKEDLNVSLKERASALFALLIIMSILVVVVDLRLWPLIALSFLGLLVLQQDFYLKLFSKLKPQAFPSILALHILYYWCAFIGLVLAKTELLRRKWE